MNIKPNILLFTVYDELETDEINSMHHAQILATLRSRGVPAIELIGKRNSQSILSILVSGFQHVDLVEKFAKQFNQETYLKSHSDRFTEEVSVKKANVKPVGYLKPISETQAWLKGTYTYNPQNNTFYALEARP